MFKKLFRSNCHKIKVYFGKMYCLKDHFVIKVQGTISHDFRVELTQKNEGQRLKDATVKSQWNVRGHEFVHGVWKMIVCDRCN